MLISLCYHAEEARQADVVGLMRYGRLLAEGKPDDLMAQYGKDTLEDTFLSLCFTQGCAHCVNVFVCSHMVAEMTARLSRSAILIE